MQWMLEEAGICGWAHALIMSQHAREHSGWKQEPSLPDGASPPWPSEGHQTTIRQLLLVRPMSWDHPSTSGEQCLMTELI